MYKKFIPKRIIWDHDAKDKWNLFRMDSSDIKYLQIMIILLKKIDGTDKKTVFSAIQQQSVILSRRQKCAHLLLL